MCGEAVDILELEQRQYCHAEPDEPLPRPERERRAVGRVAGGKRHQCRHREQRGDRSVGGRLGIADDLAEVAADVVIAADALTAHESLRRRLYAMLSLEGVRLLTCGQPAIVDGVPLALEQVLGLQSVRAHVRVHHHPVQDGAARFGDRVHG
jgi:hypothetical protein